MDPIFKKVTLLLDGKAKKSYICKAIIDGEEGASNFCNIREKSFKGMIKHLKRVHSILLPESIICHQHEVIMTTTCMVVDHLKLHIEEAASTFNYQDEGEQCLTCKSNIQCIRMCRPGMYCML